MEGVISLETPQWKRASSHLQGRTSWIFSSCGKFLSSYDGEPRDLLVWLQESPVSMRVGKGLLGYLSSRCRVLSPCLEPKSEPEVSSLVLTWILGFLWSLHRGLRPQLEGRHARPLSSRLLQQCQSSGPLDTGICGFPSRLSPRAVTRDTIV